MLIKNAGQDEDGFRLLTKSRAEELCEMFRETEYTNTMGSFELTASAGTAAGSGDYQSIYNKAYIALCSSANASV